MGGSFALADHTVVARHRDQPSHPVHFIAELYADLAFPSGPAGASAVVRAQRQEHAVFNLPVNDARILERVCKRLQGRCNAARPRKEFFSPQPTAVGHPG
jgi:hypothetical protein